MTRRQANTLMALGFALILTQILCTAVLLTRMEQFNKSGANADVATVTSQSTTTSVETAEAATAPMPTTPAEPPAAPESQSTFSVTLPDPPPPPAVIQLNGTRHVYVNSPLSITTEPDKATPSAATATPGAEPATGAPGM